jgi:hypothetical protein
MSIRPPQFLQVAQTKNVRRAEHHQSPRRLTAFRGGVDHDGGICLQRTEVPRTGALCRGNPQPQYFRDLVRGSTFRYLVGDCAYPRLDRRIPLTGGSGVSANGNTGVRNARPGRHNGALARQRGRDFHKHNSDPKCSNAIGQGRHSPTTATLRRPGKKCNSNGGLPRGRRVKRMIFSPYSWTTTRTPLRMNPRLADDEVGLEVVVATRGPEPEQPERHSEGDEREEAPSAGPGHPGSDTAGQRRFPSPRRR